MIKNTALAAVLSLALAPVLAAPALAAGVHRVVIQVSDADPAKLNLALNNAANVSVAYDGAGEQVEVEIVAYGPGLTMLLADTSPVKDRLQSFREGMPNVTFSACGNTIKAVEKKEGKPVHLAAGVRVVPAGVTRLIELQEQGWSYIRP